MATEEGAGSPERGSAIPPRADLLGFEQKLAEDNPERVHRLLHRVPVIPWEGNAVSNDFTWVGPQCERLLDYPLADWLTPGFWEKHLHPDDRERTLQLRREVGVHAHCSLEYRMLAADGRTVWIRDTVWGDGQGETPTFLAGFMIDATERKQLEGERDRLIRSREEMLAGLSTVAHDLRNPLGVVTLQVERLLHTAHRIPAELQSVAGAISRSMTSMEALLDTALDIAQLSAGRLPLQICDVDLCKVIREAVTDCRGELSRSTSALHLYTCTSLLGRSDPVRVRQVVVNLLSNAIKYGQGKPIELRLEERNGSARLSVRDHGIGIAEEERELIFEKFQRTVSARRASSGSGLGLWLVRRICEALGGSVSVSATPAGGSTFVVELPLLRLNLE